MTERMTLIDLTGDEPVISYIDRIPSNRRPLADITTQVIQNDNMGIGRRPRRRRRRNSEDEEAENAAPAVQGSGVGRGNAWINHIKAFAKANNISYWEALKSPQCKMSYRKSSGGSVLDDMRNAFDPNKNGVAKAFDPNQNGTTEFITRTLPSTLIHQGIPAVAGTLGSMAGEVIAPELGIVGAVVGNQVGKQLGKMASDKIGEATGYGFKKQGNKWIQYVKAFAEKNHMNYRDALKDPRCKASYKKGAGVLDDARNIGNAVKTGIINVLGGNLRRKNKEEMETQFRILPYN